MQAPGVDPKPQRGGRYAQIHIALIAALACGCNLDNKGDPPPAEQLYFTNALALSASDPDAGVAPRYLFAANSNYDLRYSSGSVLAIDLEEVQDLIDEHLAEDPNDPDYVIESADVVVDEAFIGTYSTALARAPDGDTLFVTTRTDSSLGFIHVDDSAEGDDVLRCADDDTGRECSLRATPTVDATTNRPLEWPADPTSILARKLSDFTGDPADEEGRACMKDDECGATTFCNAGGECEAKTAVLVSHRDGLVSLFTTAGDGYDFVDVIGGFGNSLTGLDFEPTSRLAYGSNGNSAFARVGVAVADGSPPTLYGADAVPLSASSNVIIGRDVAFLPATGGGLAGEQDSMLVVGQNPNALLLVALDGQPRDGKPVRSLRVVRSAVVGFGAYRVATGKLGDKPIAIVSCLDSREIYIIDLDTMLPLSVVPHLSGPFDLEYDEVRELVYVADYHSSVIRVLDLAPVADSNGKVPAQLVATIGQPRVIQELR